MLEMRGQMLPFMHPDLFPMSSLTAFKRSLALALATLPAFWVVAQNFTLQTAWPQPNGVVHAMALDPATGTIILGGDFTQVDGQPRDRLAAIDLATGTLTSWAPSANASVRALVVLGDSVIFGGDFTLVNGEPRTNLAAVHTTTGVSSAWAPILNERVFAMVASNGIVYAGGSFTLVNGQLRSRLCAFNATNGTLTTWNPNANTLVSAMAISGANIVVGGAFVQVGGQPRLRVAELDPVSGAATSFMADTDAPVNGLLTAGSSIHVGGLFTSLAGQPRTGVARLAATTGVPDAWAPSVTLQARCFAMAESSVVVGGFFTQVNGAPHSHLAALDPATGSLLAGSPSANSSVNAMLVHGGKLFVGGAFNVINGNQLRSCLAVFDVCTPQPWYADTDGDGFGDANTSTVACAAPNGFVADNTDCDDGDPDVGLGYVWYLDADGDEFGNQTDSVISCDQPAGYSDVNTDCDDSEFAIHPSALCDDNDPFTVGDRLRGYPECQCRGFQLVISAKVMLEGAYDETTGLMRDDLRAAGLLPLTEPYTALGYGLASGSLAGGDSMDPSVLTVTGPNAIVDWVILEIRTPLSEQGNLLSTRYVLVQRDGDVVEPDGISPVRFPVGLGNYLLAVTHRNHMGVVERRGPQNQGSYYEVTSRDFTSSDLVVFGTDSRSQAGTTLLLRAGDTSFNDEVKYVGQDNDRDPILTRIGGAIPTLTTTGYYLEDVNMDGVVKYVGNGNDRDPILISIGGVNPTLVRPHVYGNPTY